MRQFFEILKFEFFGQIKSKLFIGITIGFILVSGIGLSFPRIMGLFNNATTEPTTPTDTPKQIMFISDQASTDKNLTLKLFQNSLTDKAIELTDKNETELIALIEKGDIFSALILQSPTEYKYIASKIGMHDYTQNYIHEIMIENYRLNSMMALGVEETTATDILSTSIKGDVVQIAKDRNDTFFYTYILIMALYMAILLYGQQVAISIATEKSSRAMEMLITSANPNSLMFGKVIAAGLTGILQMTAILIGTFVFWNINASLWGDNAIMNSIFNMPIYLIFYTILFFILGFFIYAFLYGAIGSLATRVEDINTTSMPIIFLFIVAFMIVVFAMSSGNVDSMTMIIASYVPFSSPMAMFVRISMSEVAAIEIIISIAILILSIIGIGYIAAKIYRVGVLMYGKPPKLSSLFMNTKNKQ